MITSYADLLRTAAQQQQPQRLLFVFTKAILRTGLVFYFSEITKVMISRGGFNETQVKRRV